MLLSPYLLIVIYNFVYSALTYFSITWTFLSLFTYSRTVESDRLQVTERTVKCPWTHAQLPLGS